MRLAASHLSLRCCLFRPPLCLSLSHGAELNLTGEERERQAWRLARRSQILLASRGRCASWRGQLPRVGVSPPQIEGGVASTTERSAPACLRQVCGLIFARSRGAWMDHTGGCRGSCQVLEHETPSSLHERMARPSLGWDEGLFTNMPAPKHPWYVPLHLLYGINS